MKWVLPFYNVINFIFSAILTVVFIWVILSWILFFTSQSSFRWRNRGAYNILSQLNDIFSRMTYPFIRPFRRILPPHKMGGVDWSPLLLFIAIYLIRSLLTLILFG